MANAREQARKAARRAFEIKRKRVQEHNRTHPNLQIELHVSSTDYADAASDVWEPLLREVFEYLQDKHPGDFSRDCGGCSLTLKIKEVLGE